MQLRVGAQLVVDVPAQKPGGRYKTTINRGELLVQLAGELVEPHI
jgi:hypothetical protein